MSTCLPVMFLGDVSRSRSRLAVTSPGPGPDHVSRSRSRLPVPIMSPGSDHVSRSCFWAMSSGHVYHPGHVPVLVSIMSPGSDHVSPVPITSPGSDHVSRFRSRRSRLPVMFLGDVFHVSRFRSRLPRLPVPITSITSPGYVFGQCLPRLPVPITSITSPGYVFGRCLPVTSPRFPGHVSRFPGHVSRSPGLGHVSGFRSRLRVPVMSGRSWVMSPGHVPMSRSCPHVTSPGSGDVWQVPGDVSRSCPHAGHGPCLPRPLRTSPRYSSADYVCSCRSCLPVIEPIMLVIDPIMSPGHVF